MSQDIRVSETKCFKMTPEGISLEDTSKEVDSGSYPTVLRITHGVLGCFSLRYTNRSSSSNPPSLGSLAENPYASCLLNLVFGRDFVNRCIGVTKVNKKKKTRDELYQEHTEVEIPGFDNTAALRRLYDKTDRVVCGPFYGNVLLCIADPYWPQGVLDIVRRAVSVTEILCKREDKETVEDTLESIVPKTVVLQEKPYEASPIVGIGGSDSIPSVSSTDVPTAIQDRPKEQPQISTCSQLDDASSTELPEVQSQTDATSSVPTSTPKRKEPSSPEDKGTGPPPKKKAKKHHEDNATTMDTQEEKLHKISGNNTTEPPTDGTRTASSSPARTHGHTKRSSRKKSHSASTS